MVLYLNSSVVTFCGFKFFDELWIAMVDYFGGLQWLIFCGFKLFDNLWIPRRRYRVTGARGYLVDFTTEDEHMINNHI